ncbi:unnamed protein product, partial [Diamesa tonsa]
MDYELTLSIRREELLRELAELDHAYICANSGLWDLSDEELCDDESDNDEIPNNNQDIEEHIEPNIISQTDNSKKNIEPVKHFNLWPVHKEEYKISYKKIQRIVSSIRTSKRKKKRKDNKKNRDQRFDSKIDHLDEIRNKVGN